MFSAAVRVLARAATIQLEEAAAAHPRAPTRTLLKGKERAIPIRRDIRPEPAVVESDLGVHAGTEGFGGKESELAQTGKVAGGAGYGMEEHLASIVDEIPQKDQSSAGPSRISRHRSEALPRLPEDAKLLKPQSLVTGATRQALDKPEVDTPKTAPIREPATTPAPTPTPGTVSPTPVVEDSPLVQAELPVTDQLHEILDAKTDQSPSPSTTAAEEPNSAPARPVEEAVVSPLQENETKVAADLATPRADELESGDILPTTNESTLPVADETEDAPVVMRASKVPSSRIGRLFHYGSLAASMGWGAASEGLRRSAGGAASGSSVFMSDANIRRLVSTLGRMRGAALKLGQFMSIQDNHMLPPEIEKVLQQVQAHANYMPDWQMEKVMSTEFGPDWQKMFSSFDRVPIASASIGQVHKATMASTGLPVAVKIQFPGIASSISSDLSNLSILLRSSALLPKGLYLQNTIAVMKRELEDECDYIREAESGRRFSSLLKDYDFFRVPTVVDEASSSKVLTAEWMQGKALSRIRGLSQQDRDQIGENILRLCLLELFEFRFMQTDPNWANFLYDPSAKKLGLIDFGASREYTKEFMDGWYRLLMSAVKGDRDTMKDESEKLGYLTGEENEMMVKAHLDSMALVASPFCHKGPYEFAQQTITSSVRSLIPVMLAHRLTPPPQETYSLNRKLSGAFLMCAKLEARVDCSKLWDEVVGHYKQG